MPFALYLTLLASCIVIALTPGAGAINSMATSLRSGWLRTGWTVLGQELALGVQLLITALGVGLLVSRHPEVLLAVRVIGALYLAHLGLRLLLERPRAASSHQAVLPDLSAGELIRRGFIVNITNPKAILFFLAFIPQFVNPAGDLPLQYTIIMGTLVAVDIAVMWGFYALSARMMTRFTRSPQGQITLNRLFGALFLLIAGLVAFVPLEH